MRGWVLALLLGLLLTLGGSGTAAQSGCYAPQDAAAYVGTHGCVSGRVSFVLWAQQSNGRPTFVDMGSRFTIVIWEEDRDKFQPPPETWRGATLTVWGLIELYRGRAEIILRSPAQFAPPVVPVQPAPAAVAPAPIAPPAAPPPAPAIRPAPPAPVPAQPAIPQSAPSVLPPAPPPPAPAPVPAAVPTPTPTPTLVATPLSTPAPMPTPTPVPPPPPTPVPATPSAPPPTPPPSPVPTAEPSPPPTPQPTPTPTPFPAAPGGAPSQARVILTPVAPVLEGPVDAKPPLQRPAEQSGPLLLLIAGAVALVVLGIAGSILSGRRRS